MTKLEHIQDYRNYAIMIWRVVDGRTKGTRYFTVGNREHRTIGEAKSEIDGYFGYPVDANKENQFCPIDGDTDCDGCGDCEPEIKTFTVTTYGRLNNDINSKYTVEKAELHNDIKGLCDDISLKSIAKFTVKAV